MTRAVRLLFLIAIFVAAAGCTSSRNASYNATIDSVERPSDAAERYGEYTVSETDSSYVYEDDLIRAGFLNSGGSVLMNVENKTEHSIQMRLEEGAFVMPDGSSERILTGDMSFANRNQEVQPITVPSRASTTATLIPQGSISMGQYGLTVAPLFQPDLVGGPGQNTSTVDDVRENLGETFSLLLPIEIQGNVNEYTFSFEVIGAKVEANRQASEQTIGEYPGQ